MTEATAGRIQPAASRSSLQRWLRGRRGGLLAFAVLALGGWQILAPLLSESVPTPIETFSFMWDEIRAVTLAPDNLYQAFLITARRLVIGFVIAVVIGVPIGLLMGLSPRVEAYFRDLVVVLLTLPYLIWALVFSMWFGFTDTAPILTVVLSAIPFIILNVWEGVKDVPEDLLAMARAFDMKRSLVLRHVIIPSQTPFLFAAARYGFANGWKGVVVAEVFGAASGAGWTIRYWYDAHRTYGVVGYAFFFVIFSLILERVLFGKLSKYVFRWRPAVVEDQA